MAFVINLLLLLFGAWPLLGGSPVQSAPLAIALYYYILIYLPGYYLLKYFLEKDKYSMLELIPLSLCAGYIFILPWVFLSYTFNLHISVLLKLYIAAVALALLADKFLAGAKQDFSFNKIQVKGWYLFGLAAVLAAAAIMSNYYGGFISGNFLPHVSQIRKLAEFGVIEQRSCYFKDFLYDPNVYSSYYVFLSSLSWITKIDPVKIWIFLPQFIFPVGLLANFVFAGRVLKNYAAALLYVAVYFVYYALYNPGGPADGHAWLQSELSACNNYIAMGIFLPMIFLVLYDYLEEKNKKLLYLLPLLFLGQGAVHLYVQSKTYFILFSLLFMAFLIRPRPFDWKTLLKPVAFSLAGFVLFIYVFFLLQPNINPAYKTAGGTGGGLPMVFFGKWPLVNPLLTLLNDPVTIAACIFFFLLVPFVKSDFPAFYIFAIVSSVSFIIFNPLMLRFGGILQPSYERITRLYNIIPFALMLAYPLSRAFENNGNYLRKYRRYIAIALVAALAFTLKDVPKRLGAIVYNKSNSLLELGRNKPLYDLIRAHIPAGSVVMINEPLTTWWTTYFPHYIVAHAFGFVLPPNMDQTQRKKDLADFYANPFSSQGEEILRKYDVSYIFFMAAELKPFDAAKAGFLERVYANPQFEIFKVKSNAGQ